MARFFADVLVPWWFTFTFVNGQTSRTTPSTATVTRSTAEVSALVTTIRAPYEPQNEYFVGSLVGTESESTTMVLSCPPSVPTIECDFPLGATITLAPSMDFMTYTFPPPGTYIIEVSCTSTSGGANCVTATKGERYWFETESSDDARATDIVTTSESEFIDATDIPSVTVTLTAGVPSSTSSGVLTSPTTGITTSGSTGGPTGNSGASSTPPPNRAQHVAPRGLAAGLAGLAVMLI